MSDRDYSLEGAEDIRGAGAGDIRVHSLVTICRARLRYLLRLVLASRGFCGNVTFS
jgi:hypothetical protein